MIHNNVPLRAASPYEHRLAIREELGFYNAAALGAIYEFSDAAFDVKSAMSFVRPLKYCIQKFAYMSIVLKGKDTKTPFWEGVTRLELDNHIVILDYGANVEDDTRAIEAALPAIVDVRFTSALPPWRITVLPLPSRDGKPRCFIAFAISHSIGDGGAGLAFHHAFLGALRQKPSRDDDLTCVVPERELPEPFDTPGRLPVSPEFMRSVMTSSVVNEGTWTGSRVFLDGEKGLHTKIRILEFDDQVVAGALRASRAHDTKLTPTLHQLVIRALSKAIKDDTVTNFASLTATDLRAASRVGLEWGIFVSGLATSHDRVDATGPISDDMWQSARSLSTRLGEATSTLEDQMIGMLRFIPSQKDALLSKMGKTREGSYALSNMLAVDGGNVEDSCRVTKMVVATSAAVPSAPLSICLISVKGGSLVCTLSWQPGAFGLPIERESSFLDEICSSLTKDFASFVTPVRI